MSMTQASGEVGLGRKTARGGAIAMATEGAEFVIRFASIAILARLLTPEHFGLIAMITAVTTIAERFKDLGLSMATIQAKELSHEESSALFWVNAAFGLLIAAVVAALALPIARFYEEPRLLGIAAALSLGFVFGGLAVQHQALMRRQMMFGRAAAVQLGASGLSTLIAVGLALSGFGYWALVARELLRGALLAAGSWWALPWRPMRPSLKTDIRHHLRFGSNIAVFNILWYFVHNLDQIVVGRLFGAQQLGIYRQGVALILGPIYQIITPVNAVAEAALSRLQANREEYARYYVKILGTFCLVSLPIAGLVAVFAEEIIVVAMGDQWLAAAEFVRIFAIVAFVRPAASTVGFVMTTQGRSGRYLVWGCMSAAALALAILIGSRWGAQGVAWGHVAAAYLVGLPLLAFGFRGSPVGLRHFVAALWRPLAASGAMCGVLVLVRDEFDRIDGTLLRLLAGGLTGVALYFVVVVLLPGGRGELGSLIRTVRNLLPARLSSGTPR